MAAKKRKKTWKPTWRDVIGLPDTGETLDGIQKRDDRATSTQGFTGTRKLARGSIFVAERVFQWRMPNQDDVARIDHILGMANAILDSGKPLDPILVYPVGARFSVIDGHHRLAAYTAAKWTGLIPATAFNGTLREAELEALKRNIKNKLPMTKGDKQEAAWRIVKAEDGRSRTLISDDTTVSTSNISNMKSVLLRLKKMGLDPDGYTWVRARLQVSGVGYEERAEDWRELKADKIVAALRKSKIGPSLTKASDIAALALSKLNENLPRELMWEWISAPGGRELVEELLEDLETPMEF